MRPMICSPLWLSALWLAGVLSGLPLDAAEITVIEPFPVGFRVVAPPVKVNDPRFPAAFDPSWTDGIQFQESEGRVVLRIDHDQLPDADFPVTVEFEIAGTRADGARTTTRKELTVEYDPQRENGDTFIDQVVEVVPGAHLLEVKAIAIRDQSGPLTAAPINVVAEARIVLTRFDELDDGPPAILSLQPAGDQIEVSWSEISGAEEYHLEWLHVDDYLRPFADLAYDFRFDSTRVAITRAANTSPSYRISSIFEQGYLLVRVRAVGRGGTNFEQPVYGTWSSGEPGQGAVGDYPENQVLQIAATHEGDALNWQHITNFAEGGKRKESVSYFDGSLRNRQVVSRLNTENEAIVGETIYDFQGRAAIQVLPTPTGDPVIKYYRNYNQKLIPEPRRGHPYNREDFDADSGACEASAAPMWEEQRGSAHYYSSFNPDKSGMNAYIPRASSLDPALAGGGFPFTQIEFTPDNTGRIRRQSGVGPTHQLGSGHETKYFYGKPAQEHLDRLFGSEVGFNGHYKKNLVVDANGQGSVSYLDQQGRVVATALAGVKPNNLEDLGHTPEDFSVDVLDNDPLEPGDASLDSSFHHLATSAGEHAFKYSLDQADFQPDACPLCFECVYAFQGTVLDECGQVPKQIKGPDLPVFGVTARPNLGETCNDRVTRFLEFGLDLGVGKYNVHKSLAVEQGALDHYLDAYFADERCTQSLKDFVDDELSRIDFSGCQPATDCPSICVGELGDGADEAELAACIDDCERSDGCREMKQVLLGDVSPGGQYALYKIVADGKIDAEDDEYSLLNIGPNYDYKDLDGYQPGEVLIDGVAVRVQDLEPEQFVDLWQPTWAETLLRRHPEACLLGPDDAWCEGGDAALASGRYEREMREVDTFEEAFAAGFFNPLGLTGADLTGDQGLPPELSADVYAPNLDPLLPRDGDDWQQMLDFLTLYTLRPPSHDDPDFLPSAWGVAIGATACAESATAEAMAACIEGYVFDLDADVCTRDKLWLMFRALYLAKRQELGDDPFHGGGTCAPPTLRTGKVRRIVTLQGEMSAEGFGNVTHFDDDPQGLTATAQATAGDRIDDTCADQCESSAGYWLVELAGCEALDPERWEENQKHLESELAEICFISCLGGFPNGQGRVPDGASGTPAGYRGFSAAIAGVIGETSLTCNGELISSPLVYDGTPPSLTENGNLDTCACDDLLATRHDFEAVRESGELKVGVETLDEYFEFTHGFQLEGLSSKLCACDDAFVATDPEGLPWSPDAVWAPAAAGELQASGEFVPAELGCTACAGCELTDLATELRLGGIAVYGEPQNDRQSASLDRIVTRRLNQALGLDLTSLHYQEFAEQCARVAGGEPVCQELSDEALALESLLHQLSLRGELFGEPCLCQGPYRDPWLDLAPGVDASFPWGDPDAACGHTWSAEVGSGGLAAMISSGCCDLCELNLGFVDEVLAAEEGSFDRIVHFVKGSLRGDVESGAANNFLIDAVLAISGEYVTATLRGSSCFEIAECTSDPGDLSLCNQSASDDLPVGDPQDECETQLLNVAKTNALRAYEEYVRLFKEDFSHRYTDQCLNGAEESFTMDYEDHEYHYTLYYYDQAGNLVKTVPPEGIDLLTDGLDEDGRKDLFVATDSDRRTGQRTVFTNHRMATTYEYNSLNQLTYQHVPDHDDMERWDWRRVVVEPGRLGPGEHLHGAGFADSENGYVITDDPDQADHGTVYLTGDGGESWQRVDNLGRMDLHAVQVMGDSTVYAVGEGGGFLRRPAFGAWSLQAVGAETDLVDLYFSSVSNGLAFARDGKVYRTADGGNEWSPFADLVDVVTSLSEVTAADFSSAADGFVAVRAGDEGGVLRTQDGGVTWSPPGRVRAPGLTAVAAAGNTVLAAGADGRLLELSGSGSRWKSRKVGLDLPAAADSVSDLTAVALFNGDHGVVAGHSAFVRSTDDGGVTWQASMLPPGVTADVAALAVAGVSTGFAGLADGRVLKSINRGQDWTFVDSASGMDDLRVLRALSPSAFYTAGSNGSEAVVRRWNGGWQPPITIGPGTVVDFHVDEQQSAMTVLLAGGQILKRQGTAWVVTDAGPYVDFHFVSGTGNGYALAADGRLSRTSNHGLTWAPAGNVLLQGAQAVALNIVSPGVGNAGGRAFVVASDGLIHRTSSIQFPGWQVVRIALPELLDVQAFGPMRAYAVGLGGTLVKTTNGNDWTFVATGEANDLHALDFRDENAGMVAGAGGVILEGSGIATAPSWVRGQTPDPTVAISSLAVGNSVAYATGAGGLLLKRGAGQPIWDQVDLATAEDLNAIVSAGTAGAVLVGDQGVIADETATILGGEFRTESLFATHNLGTVAWAVGADGAILKSEDIGVSWVPQASGTHEDFRGVYFTDPDNGYAVGDAGTGVRTQDGGQTWRALTIGGGDLTDVHFGTGATFGTPDPKTGVAVGRGGRIIANGVGEVDSKTSNDLAAVYFVNHVGYAVGAAGTILKSVDSGSTWELLEPEPGANWANWLLTKPSDPPVHRDLKDVYFRDYVTGYVLGEQGLLLKTINGGLSWTLEDTGVTNGLRDLVLFDQDRAFVSASDGTGFLLEDLTDRFSTRFWYDGLGRLVASQNSKQFAFEDDLGRSHFSYTTYDPLGRIVEVGQLLADEEPSFEIMNGVGYPDNWSPVREQVTKTFYDEPMNQVVDDRFGPEGQENLRNRVASAAIFDDLNPGTDYYHATHYSYDIHGNVKTLIQDNQLLARDFPSQRFKRIDYEYDLVSGNVNEVLYQEDARDAFYHRYEYDADNRIVSVETSRDKVIWDQDATYEYYKHGPLGRTEIGENKVQGVDYAYTIQGWLKGVNSDGLSPDRDMGRDGSSGRGHELVARDAFGFSLGYYENDYQPVDAQAGDSLLARGSGFLNEREYLFNGNIGNMLTSLTKPGGAFLDVQGGAYRYDQLNRLVRATYFQSSDQDSFSSASSSGDYDVPKISYDASGNILSLERNGADDFRLMDKMNYRYFEIGGHKKSNRLLHVNDEHVTASFEDDIEDQGVFEQRDEDSWNYSYDNFGNLVQDNQEEIRAIGWTVYGKVQRVSRDGGSQADDLEFRYDANGNRMAKIVKPDGTAINNGGTDQPEEWTTTSYVRDALGNVMSIYTHRTPAGGGGPDQPTVLRLEEQAIYGSSRVGLVNRHLDLAAFPPGGQGIRHAVGQVQYELTNHLGNVLATVSDNIIVEGVGACEENRFDSGSSSDTEGWMISLLQTTLTQVAGRLEIVSQTNFGGIEKHFTTVAGQMYSLRLELDRTAVKTGMIFGVWIDGQFNNVLSSELRQGANAVTFAARDASTSIAIVNSLANFAGGALYYVDDVVICPLDIAADVTSASDYYPFGALMGNRDFSSDSYRFGLSGMEKDDELKGNGNSYDFGARIYDARLGRWLAVDPLFRMVPDMGPYTYARNTPLFYIDADGEDIKPGANWSGSGYERVYNKLKTSSAFFKGIVDGFEGSKSFNLTLKIDNTTGTKVTGQTTIDPGEFTLKRGSNGEEKLSSAEVKMTFYVKNDGLNDFGKVVNLLHEAIHADLYRDPNLPARFHDKKRNMHHDKIADEYRDDIKQGLTDYNSSNGNKLTNDEIDLISWGGLLNSREGHKKIASYAKENHGVVLTSNSPDTEWTKYGKEIQGKIESLISEDKEFEESGSEDAGGDKKRALPKKGSGTEGGQYEDY